MTVAIMGVEDPAKGSNTSIEFNHCTMVELMP